MTNNDWKKEYITKGQAINAIVHNFSKIKQMPLVNGVEKYIKNLSTLKQEPKTGHWKSFTHNAYHGIDDDGEPIWREVKVYHCNLCNRRTVIKENYCPNCGARMESEE